MSDSEASDRYDLIISNGMNGVDEFDMDSVNGEEDVAMGADDHPQKEELLRLQKLMQVQLAREEQLGPRNCDPAHLLNEAGSILRAVALIQKKDFPEREKLLKMAADALVGRLEPPLLASMVKTADEKWTAGPLVRRVAATGMCMLMVAAPQDLDISFKPMQEQVRTIMSKESDKMMGAECDSMKSHLYKGLRAVRVMPVQYMPVLLTNQEIPSMPCKCTHPNTHPTLDEDRDGEFSLAKKMFEAIKTSQRASDELRPPLESLLRERG